MANLMLHCGANLVDRNVLDTIETPSPEGRHYPIPHTQLFEQVETALGGHGMHVAQTQHALSHEGARYFGLIELKTDPDADYATIVGLRNSHDKSIVAGICCGSQVFVCDNLAFSAEVVVARKHTRHILRDLDQMIARSIGELVGLRVQQSERIDAYKNHDLTRERAHHLMMEMIRAQVFAPSKITKIIKEWDEPSHEEFADRENGWRLFNAVTDQARGNVFALPKRTQALHGLLDQECGIAFQQAA